MMNKMNEIFRKVLNDRDIFDSPFDNHKNDTIPKLFEGENWKELGKLFDNGKKEEFEKRIDESFKKIKEKEIQGKNKWRISKIKELEKRAEWLKKAFDNKPNLLMQLFGNLDWYGLVECKLPSMDNYGKVIERYDISIVEQYFIDRANRVSEHQKRALKKVLEYIKELYKSGVSSEQIAYFVRKLNSLTKYWEVIE